MHRATPLNIERFIAGTVRRLTCPNCGGTCTCPRDPGMAGHRVVSCCYCNWNHTIVISPDGVVTYYQAPDPRAKTDHRYGKRCAAYKCHKIVKRNGLCPRHLRDWLKAGEPDLAGWINGTRPKPPPDKAPDRPAKPRTSPRRVGRSTCGVDGCACPVKGYGLCALHYERYVSCGRPSKATWLSLGGPGKIEYCEKMGLPSPRHPNRPAGPKPPCVVDGCDDPVQGRNGLCWKHEQRYRAACRPDLEAFIAAGAPLAKVWREQAPWRWPDEEDEEDAA